MADPFVVEDGILLLALLNSSSVGQAGAEDAPGLDERASDWGLAHGGAGSAAEATHLRAARDSLQQVLWGRRSAGAQTSLLSGVCGEPQLDRDGLQVQLRVDDGDRVLAVRAVLAWGLVTREWPGRLRACANDECRLFLLDRTRANTARWCSMATCGNRMKARRHRRRTLP